MPVKFILIVFLFLSKSSLAQCKCDSFFDSTVFTTNLKQNIDTFCFKATFHNIGKISQSNILKRLSAKGLINKKDYKTAISFTPLQTNNSMYLPYKDTDPVIYHKLFINQNMKMTICIKGIIIKEFKKVNDKPFFIINKIWIEN